MALYSYQSLSKEGKKISGFLDASSLQDAKAKLYSRGLYIVSISTAEGDTGRPWYKRLFEGGVSLKDKIMFTKQLAVLLRSGIPLLQTLELLIDQFEGKMRSIIVDLKDGVKEGLSLAEGLKKYPKFFDNIYIQLVRAGEATGKLEVILDRLALFLEKKQALQSKIKSALRYPMIQLSVVILVVIFLLTFVVPRIAQIFIDAGSQLPTPTRIVMAASNFLQHHYILLLILVISLSSAFIYWKASPSGAKTLDKIKLKLPMIKFFSKTNAVVQFSKTLGMLLEGGVNLSEALDIVCNIVTNRVLADQLNEAKDKIIKEGRIAEYLKQTKIFPPIAIYLIRTGEQSGELAKMLLTVGDNYEQELSELTDKLTGTMEPIIMAFMAIVVGFVVIAVATPIMQMSQLASSM